MFENYPTSEPNKGLDYWANMCPYAGPSICPSFRPSVRGHIFPKLFSYILARTALKLIHNVCVHMKLCMCNFHDHTIICCGIIFIIWTCKFYWISAVQINNPTVLHVLNSKLHTMLLVVSSSACAIFITILSLVAELSPLELVNFTKSLLSTPTLTHSTQWHLLKTLWEKEKLLVTSNFSFTHSAFYLDNLLPFSSNLTLLSVNSFSLEESKNLSSGYGLRNRLWKHNVTEKKFLLYQMSIIN